MADIVTYKKFIDDGNDKRESENFQQFLFKDLDFSRSDTPISFYRSDFREVKIEKVIFMSNEFERADFTDSYVTDSSFISSHFGTDFINVYFNNVIFENSLFDTCTFLRCIFNSCRFSSGHIINSTVQDCNFYDCTLNEIELKENTFEEIDFENTHFKGINLANMTSKDFRFRNCNYDKLTIDPDYLGSYVIEGDFFNDIQFEYRGHVIEVFQEKGDTIEALINLWRKSNRFYEVFNLLILHRQFKNSKNDLSDILITIIDRLSKVNHPSIRAYNLRGILKTMTFYSTTEYLSIREYLALISMLESIIDVKNDFNVYGQFKAFSSYFENVLVDNPSKGEDLIVQAKFNLKDVNNVEEQLQEWLRETEEYVITNKIIDAQKLYEIIGVEKGSIVITIFASLSFLLILIRQIVTLGSKIKRERNFNLFVSNAYAELSKSFSKEDVSIKKKKEIVQIYKVLSSKENLSSLDNELSTITKKFNLLEKSINKLDIFT